MKSGNDQATRQFYELVWPHRAAILRTALILCGNQAEAEDLAQETLLKAFKSLGQFRQGTQIKSWLLAILRNARIDRLRSGAAGGANVSLDQLPIDPAAAPQADAAWDTPQDLLQQFSDQQIIQALQDLPEDIRWTLLLVDVDGMDHADAAALLEIPVGTVKSRTHRGRAVLRRILLPLARQLRLIPDGSET